MILNYIIVIGLVILSATFSGLTLGLFSLNTFELSRKAELGNKNAKKVYPLRKKGNTLLCVLLLGNVAVNSTIAVFLANIATGIVAGLISTALIVVFGEIIPQALFARYPLKLGAKTTWLVSGFYFLLWPIARPTGIILDKFLGGEIPSAVSKKEMKLLLEEQQHLDASDIDETERKIIEKSLFFSDKSVKDIMTPRVNVFFLEETDVLTDELFSTIHQNGHSRIPVYKDAVDNIVGILYVKDLIVTDGNIQVKDIMRTEVNYVTEQNKLDTILDLFKSKRRHMFMVSDPFGGMAGIVTFEDVIEEILGEIVDEFDKQVDMRKPINSD